MIFMRVTIETIPIMGDTEPEPAIFCIWTKRLSMVGLEHQPSHKLQTSCLQDMMSQWHLRTCRSSPPMTGLHVIFTDIILCLCIKLGPTNERKPGICLSETELICLL